LPRFGTGRRAIAVVAGAYVNVAPLANSTNDARLMAATLRGLGFTLVGWWLCAFACFAGAYWVTREPVGS